MESSYTRNIVIVPVTMTKQVCGDSRTTAGSKITTLYLLEEFDSEAVFLLIERQTLTATLI